MKRKNPIVRWTPFEEASVPDRMMDIVGRDSKVFRNSRYTVWIRESPLPEMGAVVLHLSIKRNDRRVIHDWRDLQRIKNELVGPEREAVEIYPAESRLVDGANQYHLWVLPEGFAFPFGFFEGRRVSEGSTEGSVQRPFDDDNRPDDVKQVNGSIEDAIKQFGG